MNATKPVRVSTGSKGVKALRSALANRTPFQTVGSLKGQAWTQEMVTRWDLGRLNDVEANRFMIDHLAGIAFVVWSYGTPIGWVCEDGEVYTVSQKFSVTTTRHQGYLYYLRHPEMAW